MDFIRALNDGNPRAQRKIEQICDNFDMDCVDLNHQACWQGAPGIMPCCGREVEFEKVRGICPFLWVQEHG